MAVHGADANQLRAAATQFSKGASALESSAKTLHSLIGTTTQWRGPDADRFRSQWSSTSARTITAAVNALREAADILRRNATEQDKASAASSGDAVTTQTYRRGPSAATAADLFARARSDVADATKDGFHTETVIGPDGKTRLIAYFDGTLSADRLTVERNAPVALGWVDPYLTKKLDSALDKLPDGHKSDVMLVGFSQGGMDAQNLAASGRYHVTNLVTFGSPIINVDNDGINTVHLRATGDTVPWTSLLGAAGNAMQNPPVVGIGQAIGDMANYFQRANSWVFESDPHVAPAGFSLVGNHGDLAYQRVAADFDNSHDPRFADVKKSMANFTGTSPSPSR